MCKRLTQSTNYHIIITALIITARRIPPAGFLFPFQLRGRSWVPCASVRTNSRLWVFRQHRRPDGRMVVVCRDAMNRVSTSTFHQFHAHFLRKSLSDPFIFPFWKPAFFCQKVALSVKMCHFLLKKCCFILLKINKIFLKIAWQVNLDIVYLQLNFIYSSFKI